MSGPLHVVVIVDGDGELEATLIGLRDEGLTGRDDVEIIVCVGADGPTPVEALALADHGLTATMGETAVAAARAAISGLHDGRLLVLRAGDVPEDGFSETLTRLGRATTTMLRLTRNVEGAVSATHPFKDRFRYGTRTTTLDTEPHLLTQRLSGAVLTVPEGGLPAWDDEDADGSILLIRHLAATGGRVQVLDEPGVVERPRPEPRPLTRFADYEQALGHDVPSWLAAVEPTPAWVHHLVIARLLDVTEADRGLRFAAAELDEEERSRVRELLRASLARIPAAAVETYCASPVALNRRAALLAATGGRMPEPILPSERSFHPDRQVSYFFTGALPEERWTVGGAPAEPTSTKIVDHTYFDDVLVHERIVWLPKGGAVAVSLDDVEHVAAPYRGMLRPPAPPAPLPNRVRRRAVRELHRTARRGRRLLARGARRLPGRMPLPEASAAETPRPSVTPPGRQPESRPTWLYMDRHDSAGDNAEPLYRYARVHAPAVRHVFALDPGCEDWRRLSADGFELVALGSPAFDEAWSAADTLLLADIGDPAIAMRLLGSGTRKDQRVVFLQHGVTMRHMWRWFNTHRIDVLLTATPTEDEGITADHSPYLLTEREVWRTGFPRHDELHGLLGLERDRVLLAPTWAPLVSRELDADPSRTELLDALYAPWLDLAARLEEDGAPVVLFAHPKLALTAAAWFEDLDVVTTTGRDVPDQLSRAWAVVSDSSSVLDDGMLLGAVGIVWNPRGTGDADHYRELHLAAGAVGAEEAADVLDMVRRVRAGEITPVADLVIPDDGARARIVARLLEKEI